MEMRINWDTKDGPMPWDNHCWWIIILLEVMILSGFSWSMYWEGTMKLLSEDWMLVKNQDINEASYMFGAVSKKWFMSDGRILLRRNILSNWYIAHHTCMPSLWQSVTWFDSWQCDWMNTLIEMNYRVTEWQMAIWSAYSTGYLTDYRTII